MIIMLNKLFREVYSIFCYIITYLMLMSLVLTLTKYLLNNFAINFYSSNYILINTISLFVWGIIIFLFVKTSYKPHRWINHLD